MIKKKCMVDQSMLGYEEGKSKSMNFKETELRLGLPGGEEKNGTVNYGKRGYGETVEKSDDHLSHGKENNDQLLIIPRSNDPVKPPAKAQVVGWPPVRSFRRNIMAVQKNNSMDTDKGTTVVTGGSAVFVKVSMDGAPYLRKVDLNMYKAYQELSEALCKMFSSFTIGKCDSKGMMDLMNGSDYVPTYEDKDGDWMLVGDVPWEMFVGSCKRVRIMKGTEAIGLAPGAVEKCKNRN